MTRIKLGIAFAGGGVRGASHLGVVQALHDNGIYPEIYAGTSAGSIVASLLAYGYTPEGALKKFMEATENLIDIAFGHILKGTFTSSRIEGFVSGNTLERILDDMFQGQNIGDVTNPLAIVTSDIDEGKQIIFSNRLFKDMNMVNDDDFSWFYSSIVDYKLSEVVRASSGLPPIFIPKRIHNMKLVDGGITNNLPSDIAWALGADKVISLDLGYAGKVETGGFVDIAHMAVNLLMERVTDGNSKDYGLYLNPHIYDVKALDTNRIIECFDRGYVYGLNHIDDVVRMLEEE
jgi:NTE family protein